MKMKRLTALLLCVLLLLPALPVAAVEPAGEMDAETEFLRQLGILKGFEDEPDLPVTRAEFCVMVIRAMGREGDVSLHTARTIFRDVTASHWARGYINLAASITVGGGNTRLAAGVGTGQFKPDAAITYAQAVTILMRMLGFGDREAGAIWPNGYLNLAASFGVTDGLSGSVHGSITRKQAAVLMNNALRAEVSGGEPYYKSMPGIASVRKVTILDTAAVSGGVDGLLRIRTETGVEELRQENPVAAAFVGYTGELLLNGNGRAVAFLPEKPAGMKVVLSDAAVDGVAASGKRYEMHSDAVMIVGKTVYAWKETGNLQAYRSLGSVVWMFCDDLGKVSCIYRPVTDDVRETKMAVTSAQPVILLDQDRNQAQATAYALAGNAATVETYVCATALSDTYRGQIGRLLLNAEEEVVGFIPDAKQAEEVKLASVKRSGIVDDAGVTHRVTGTAAVVLGDTVYTWSETGYLQLNSHAGKSLRLYRNEQGIVAYVCLFAGGASAQTDVIMAETITAASELTRRLGITGAYSITKNGAPAKEDDLARYDVAYFDAVSHTLRVSDRQFTGYIDSAYPNLAEAETITVSGNKITVLESAWASLADYALGGRVTLLLTDDGKAAMAAPREAQTEMLGVLSTDGTSVTLLGSGLELKGMKISADEKLFGSIVVVRAYQDEVTCAAYTSGQKALNIGDRMLGDDPLAPVCAVFEHTISGALKSHVYSLSGEIGQASYDFREIFWTDTIPANAVTAYHLNTAGQVDMILLRDVTGNCYEYGRATKYTGEEGINLGVPGLDAYNSAVTITNSEGTGAKRICSYYEAQTGAWLGITAATHDTASQQVVSIKTLTEDKTADQGDFFLKDNLWYAVADAAEFPVSQKVHIYLERTDSWVGGETALPDVLAMGEDMILYYDRPAAEGGQIRVIVVEK